MRGIICSGKKEGSKFISFEPYKRQFIEKLGFSPYPGTLNIKVEKDIVNDLKKISGIVIEGFEKNGKKYGKVNCFPIYFKEEAYLILPEKSKYDDVVEIISKENLREKYNLEDGDEIKFYFKPFIKKSLKYKIYAKPFVGKKEEKITIFYDEPFSNGRRDLCYFEEINESYRKTIAEQIVASIIFNENGKKAYEDLMNYVKKNCYGIMSPIRKISYSKLKEWQVEVKIKEK